MSKNRSWLAQFVLEQKCVPWFVTTRWRDFWQRMKTQTRPEPKPEPKPEIIPETKPQRLPPVGKVNFGDLRRLGPVHEDFGWLTGQVIDRYYIENFLARHAQDICGRVMEIGIDDYTVRFGGDKVTKSDVLHYVEGNPKATIIADLTKADNIPSDTFDCIIITQTLQMIFDIRAAIKHIHRILKPGGVVLATSHGTSKIGRFLGVDAWGTYWHFTAQSKRFLFEEHFPRQNVQVEAWGNILSATAFLYGLVVEDLKTEEMAYQDPRYEVIVTVRAVK
jgi:SAM-dependent methyltransferase